MGKGSKAEGLNSENFGLQPVLLSLVLLVVPFSHASRESRYHSYTGRAMRISERPRESFTGTIWAHCPRSPLPILP